MAPMVLPLLLTALLTKAEPAMLWMPGLALALVLPPVAARSDCPGRDSVPGAPFFSEAMRAETGMAGDPGRCDGVAAEAAWFIARPTSSRTAINRVSSAGPLLVPSYPRLDLALPDTTPAGRPHAIQYSQFYYTRLAIHRYASYATLPLFAAEYILGEKLYRNDSTASSGLRGAHSAVALAIGGLFAINTVTGGWNLWQSRKDPEGRTRRYLHAALMFLGDAGFVATAATAPGHERERDGVVIPANGNKSLHRNLAIASFSTSLVGYLMMLLWK